MDEKVSESLPEGCKWDESTYTLTLKGGEYCTIAFFDEKEATYTMVVEGQCELKGDEACVCADTPIYITGEGSLSIESEMPSINSTHPITIEDLKHLKIVTGMSGILTYEGIQADISILDCEFVEIKYSGGGEDRYCAIDPTRRS